MEINAIQRKLAAKDLSFVINRELPGADGQSASYFYARAVNNTAFFVELKLKAGMNVCKVTVKSANKIYGEHCKVAIAKVLLG